MSASEAKADTANSNDVTTNNTQTIAAPTENGVFSDKRHHNNNYVNFNEFIMQHNLSTLPTLNPNINATVGDMSNQGNDVLNAMALATNRTSGVADSGVFNQNSLFNFPSSSNNTSIGGNPEQSSFFSNNANLFDIPTTSGLATSNIFMNDFTNNYNGTPAASYPFENLYTPFGNDNTRYFANPFATGFDFNPSNLQVSAPEFVPRFNKLTLNDDTETLTNTPQQSNFTDPFNNIASAAEAEENFAKFNPLIEQSKVNTNGSTNDLLNGATTSSSAVSSFPSYVPAETSSSVALQENAAPTRTNSYAGNNKNSTRSHNPFSNGLPQNNNTHRNGSSSSGNHSSSSGNRNVFDKTAAVRADRDRERDRERDNRRYQNGRRSVEIQEREERIFERGERDRERGGGNHRGNRNDRDYHQRYDNHRSNKRRDDWNRNRDRINGFRVDEKYSQDNKDSPLQSPEKSPKKVVIENEKLSQREKLIRDIETRRLECLVCVEPIKGYHYVWSCNNCYHIFHLQCITKWASSSRSEDGWRCPACQNVEKEVPYDYYCFCGRVKNPAYNRQEIAHTCGEVCGRVEGCVHACTLLCHPGPCPPCQANVKRECGCGKTTKLMQCFLKEVIQCDSICGKLLNCDLHTCKVKCHEGKCEPCDEKVDQICYCSKNERQVACTRDSHEKRNYSCGKPCGKDLSCGNHKCKDCCHSGECRPCKQSPEVVTSCPCGKMLLPPDQRKSCLDEIPVCEDICGKALRCGKSANPHRCTNKCHLGNCPPCNKQTAVKCRCGHMDQMIKCRQLSTRADDARCKKRCVKKRSCGKHKCNQECCIDIDHLCTLPCNYTLSCGKHKCDQPCHRGNCPPCYRSSFDELYCECGAEVIYPPVPCGTKRPPCKRHCSRRHPCEHPPQHSCHSAATCPPCMLFTTKWCFGKHEQRKTVPCSQESFSCGMACGKQLPCGRHKCIKPCHEGPCQTVGEVCKQNCTTLRSTCGHKCMAPCHEGSCPDTPCKEMVEVQCECGNRKQMRVCHDLAREFSRIATAQLASSMAEMQRGNYMELSEILAPVKVNKTNKTLDCNEECRLMERNRRLAAGLQTRSTETPQKLLTKYSDFIRNFAKRDPQLVKSIYENLTNLVKLAKESKQKSRSHSFPTMNREKRHLVHEMCEMFGVDSVAYDAEPNRNVVATAYKEKCWFPATSIMDVMQREAGQRRVPVPNNNAWGMKR